MPELFGPAIMRIAEMLGDRLRPLVTDIIERFPNRLGRGVTLRSRRQINDRVREIELGFRQSDELDGLGGGHATTDPSNPRSRRPHWRR